MKRILLIFILTLLFIGNAWAQRLKVGDLYYKITDKVNKNVEVTYEYEHSSLNYSNLSSSLSIPDAITYNDTQYNVTSIGQNAFSSSGLSQITIPNSVTKIENSAFSNCSSLSQVSIGNGVISIDDNAFFVCSELTQINIPDNVKSIGDNVFCGCQKLKYVTIGSGVTTIGYGAFSDTYIYDNTDNWKNDVLYIDKCLIEANYRLKGKYEIAVGTRLIADEAFNSCSELVQVTIPNSVLSIGSAAFRSCKSLTEVTIPNSVLSIGFDAFYGCTALAEVTISSSITIIEPSVFGDCSSLTKVTIPDGVTSIGRNAFCGCTALTDVTIPNSVTSIGEYAFWCCSALTQIVIPNSVTSIGEYAFSDCSLLSHVTIGNSVTSIGDKAFYNTEFYNNTDNWINNVLYIDNCLISANEELSGSYEILSGTRVIASLAFCDCYSLIKVTVPNSVRNICDYAFIYCTSLNHVSIGNGVKNISNWVFSGCTALGSINCYAIVPPVVTSDTFGNMNKSIQLHIPTESLDSYKAADYWKDFINMVADLNSTPSSVSADLAAELHAWQINGEVMVEYTQNIKVIELYDMNGCLISHKKVNGYGMLVIPVNSNMYIVKAICVDGTTIDQKVM